MSEATTSPRAAHRARQHRRGSVVGRQCLALRFSLIIGDNRLADALQVACHEDAVTVEFPETSLRIGLARLRSEGDGSIVLHCRASYRSGDLSPRETTRAWQRVLTGRTGPLHQREALLREILAARRRAPGRAASRPGPASLRYLAAAV